MPATEIELPGGNVNTSVVRVGDTVRRHTTPASPAVHQLLHHLEQKGFPGSPRFLGLDEHGREVLSFIEGQSGIPSGIWQQDEPLVAAARLLRAYHDATLDFEVQDSYSWAYRDPDPGRHEVICHSDFAPYNFIYDSGIPIAVIDFDLVGPGPRLKDIAYCAYWMVPMSFNSQDQLSFTEADIQNGGRRCRLFCQAYGIQPGPAFFDMIAEVLAFMGDEASMRQMIGPKSTAKLKEDGHLSHWQRESRSYQVNRTRLEANLLNA